MSQLKIIVGDTRRATLKATLAGVAAVMLCSSAGGQSVPTSMNFQGRLTDSANNPLTGSHAFIFGIYSAPVVGISFWTETQPSVTVTNGVFAVQLGNVTPIPATVFVSSSVYLQITVDGVALSPREKLQTSPYAFNTELLHGRDFNSLVSTDAANQSIAF